MEPATLKAEQTKKPSSSTLTPDNIVDIIIYYFQYFWGWCDGEGEGFVSAPLGFTLWSLKSQDLWSVKQ